MKVVAAGLVGLVALIPAAVMSAATPLDEDVTIDDLLDAEDSFAIAAEADGYEPLGDFACAIRGNAAICYATFDDGIVQGTAAWGKGRPEWSFAEFGTDASTTEVPASTAEQPGQGTRTDPVPIGTPASVGGGWTAVVNEVDLDATNLVLGANQFNEPPAPGSVYILIDVTITYDGAEPSDTGGVYFQALGASNVTMDEGGRNYAVPPTPLDSYTEVFQGGSLTGELVFEVPTSDLDSLVIIGHAFMSFDEAERSFFATR